jgi:hypothetical protein
MRGARRCAALLLVALFPATAAAEGEAAAEGRCRAGDFVQSGVPLRAGVVRVQTDEARPSLLADEGGCPQIAGTLPDRIAGSARASR